MCAMLQRDLLKSERRLDHRARGQRVPENPDEPVRRDIEIVIELLDVDETIDDAPDDRPEQIGGGGPTDRDTAIENDGREGSADCEVLMILRPGDSGRDRTEHGG